MVRDGYFYGIALLTVAVALALLTHTWYWSLIPLAFAAFFLWFFRDPQRTIPEGAGLVVSPADGRITSIHPVITRNGERISISIFLSVFNVHVNRSPVAGRVSEVRYKKGAFLNAMNPRSADRNEQNTCVVDTGDGYHIVFKQIAGLLARRIVFRPAVGDRLERGQRVGLIKFGSRTDILLPPYARILVSVGETVAGGSSILAQIARPLDAAAAVPQAFEASEKTPSMAETLP
jgi:phosphatidylserine decarboxylase